MITKPPFFIIGCGRSGTSLLRTMLNHHPQVSIPLESLFIADYLSCPKKIPLITLKKLIINEPEIFEWGLKLTPESINNCKTKKELIDRVNILYMKKNRKNMWGQKTPRFIRYWKLIKQFYPKSKFLHLIRDPRATVNSLKRSNVHFSNCLYASKRWNMDLKYGLDLKKKYPKDILEVRYSNLVENPKSELLRICKFLSIEYSPKMLNYKNLGGKEYSPYYSKIHKNLGAVPDKRLINKWKEEMSENEIELVEFTNYKLMKRLGFKLINRKPVINNAFILKMKIQRIYGLIRQVLNYLYLRRSFFIYSLKRKYTMGYLTKDVKQINY